MKYFSVLILSLFMTGCISEEENKQKNLDSPLDLVWTNWNYDILRVNDCVLMAVPKYDRGNPSLFNICDCDSIEISSLENIITMEEKWKQK